MPLYYFEIHDSFVITDQDGTELPGPVQARIAAVRFAGSYLHDHPDLVWDGHELHVQVFDEKRALLTTIIVSAADEWPMREQIARESKDREST